MDQFRGLASLGTRDILVTHCLAYGATIQLHKNFASRNANSNQKCLDAASAVVVILNRANLSDIVYLNPIIGVRVLIPETLSQLSPIYRRFGWLSVACSSQRF